MFKCECKHWSTLVHIEEQRGFIRAVLTDRTLASQTSLLKNVLMVRQYALCTHVELQTACMRLCLPLHGPDGPVSLPQDLENNTCLL